MPPPLAPNQPQPSSGLVVQLPTYVIPVTPVIPARPLRLGTGGNAALVSPEVPDSIFGNNLQEDEMAPFGGREGEGPSTEVPTQELIDQLSGLGEMDDLFRGEGVPPTAPGAAGTGTSPDGSDLLHDDFNFDASGSSDGNVEKRDAEDESHKNDSQHDSLNLDGAALPRRHEAETDEVFAGFGPAPRLAAQTAGLALANDNDWSTRSQAAIGAAVIWLMKSGELAGEKEDSVRRYEIRQNN